MRVIVMTSDKYLSALRPFAWLFNKYWSPMQPVLIVGFTPPAFSLPDNFTFHSIGRFEDYPIGRWSDALIDLLNAIDDEAFVLMLEDYWITRPVNTEAVRMCYDYCRQFNNVLRVDLTTDRLFSGGPRYPGDIPDYGYCGYLDLISTPPDTPYQMSLMAAVWRRDNLLKCLVPGETPWQLEIEGTARLAQETDFLVLGTRNWPIRHTLGYRLGDPGQAHTGEMRPGDVEELKGMGWL